MGSRIEIVEVASFRLEVPRLALERLVAELKPELPVRLERQNGRWVLSHVGHASVLRFEPGVDTVELTDVTIQDDPSGVFFHAVLGGLMIRFHGDLEARLIHDPSEDAPESWTSVTIRRGTTTYPGLATRTARFAHLAAPEVSATAGAGGGNDAPAPEAEIPLSPEEEELSRLLEAADASWQEYQRLKAERERDGDKTP